MTCYGPSDIFSSKNRKIVPVDQEFDDPISKDPKPVKPKPRDSSISYEDPKPVNPEPIDSSVSENSDDNSLINECINNGERIKLSKGVYYWYYYHQ